MISAVAKEAKGQKQLSTERTTTSFGCSTYHTRDAAKQGCRALATPWPSTSRDRPGCRGSRPRFS